jgi:hypothetical protein
LVAQAQLAQLDSTDQQVQPGQQVLQVQVLRARKALLDSKEQVVQPDH